MIESPSRTYAPARQGFSLLELVLVVAITSIVAAVAIPRFARAEARYHADLAARRLAMDFALASHQARNAGASRTVTFNAAGTGYTISDLAGFGKSNQPYQVDISAKPYRSQIESVDFGPSRSVTFDGYGQPDKGGTVVLKCGPFTHTVTLDANSAEASVQ